MAADVEIVKTVETKKQRNKEGSDRELVSGPTVGPSLLLVSLLLCTTYTPSAIDSNKVVPLRELIPDSSNDPVYSNIMDMMRTILMDLKLPYASSR